MKARSLMSLFLILLFNTYLISAGKGDFKDEPSCPDAAAIAPACKCIKDNVTMALDMDCTGTNSTFLLKHAFQADFPTKEMNKLHMFGSEITILESGIFRDISFKHFDVRYGDLEIVEEGVLDGSRHTAEIIDFSSNLINSFPFESLKKFTVLKELFFNSNELPSMPVIESSTLDNVNLAYNPMKKVNPDAFRGLPSLTRLGLYNDELDNFPPGVFSDLPNLTFINLQGNRLTHLPRDMFKGNPKLNTINMQGNTIERVEPGAFPENLHLIVRLSQNKLKVLEELVWRTLFNEGVTVQMEYSVPLGCGCDVKWLVTEKPILIMMPDVHCDSGILIRDLNPVDFDYCP